MENRVLVASVNPIGIINIHFPPFPRLSCLLYLFLFRAAYFITDDFGENNPTRFAKRWREVIRFRRTRSSNNFFIFSSIISIFFPPPPPRVNARNNRTLAKVFSPLQSERNIDGKIYIFARTTSSVIKILVSSISAMPGDSGNFSSRGSR